MKQVNIIFALLLVFGIGCTGYDRQLQRRMPKPNEAPVPVPVVNQNLDLVREAALKERSQRCRSSDIAPLMPVLDLSHSSAAVGENSQLTQIRAQLAASCQSCHLHPMNSGGFSYVDSYASQVVLADGIEKRVPGIADAAEKMRDSIADEQMPPAFSKDPDRYRKVASTLAEWIDSGKLANEAPTRIAGQPNHNLKYWGNADVARFSEIGDCIPKELGQDPSKDLYFAFTDSLPKSLADTDLFTFDPDLLASHGTASYTVEYPLWTAHTIKPRHIHIPVTSDQSGKFRKQVASWDREKDTFELPENTRLYKTFFREILDENGAKQYRPLETRVIVTRKAPREPLFGTYIWTEDGNQATLLTEPYRDGTPWKDHVIKDVLVDMRSKTTRDYAVPARHRCVECHMGAPTGDYNLGFTPLQINRRRLGEAGREFPSGADEANQVERLIQYGILEPTSNSEELPKLENYPSTRKQSKHALRAQGYFVGNCAHCHSPVGYASKQHNIKLNLSAGALFHFNTNQTSSQFSNLLYVDESGNLDNSYLYFRLAASKSELKSQASMPMHTPGPASCRALNYVSRWIKSLSGKLSNAELDLFSVKQLCDNPDNTVGEPLEWLEQDFTATSTSYAPRRLDWADPVNGMPKEFIDLQKTENLDKAMNKVYPVGFYRSKPEQCSFPNAELAEADKRPWMLRNGEPKAPLGSIYYSTPGAWYYRSTCSRCHGDKGEGDGPVSRQLRDASGGSIEVPNLAKGLFGDAERNLQLFQVAGSDGVSRNLAPNYLIWMALGGTNMKVPEELSELLGRHRALMLLQVQDRCATMIPSSPKASKPIYEEHEIFNAVCTVDNLPVDHPDIQFGENELPVNSEAQAAWLRKASQNAGWAIFSYLRGAVSSGNWTPGRNDCEVTFPKQ
jgi:hypothetical protein